MSSSEVESWVWLGLVIAIGALRFISRILHVGSIRKLQIEDMLMAFVLVSYTCLTVFLYEVDKYGTNEIPPSEFDDISPDSVPSLVYGSKLVIVVEQFWLATIWGCKACLLMLYAVITAGLWQYKAVKAIAVFCAVGYLVIEICFFTAWCRPFHNYWSVPPATFQCAVYHSHLILVLSINTFTDLLMMAVPLPILLRARLSPLKKTILVAVFSLGIFVIICSIMSKFYSLSKPYGSEWVAWYVREAGTAVIVANIPQIWTLVRYLFNVHSFISGSSGRTQKSRTASGINRSFQFSSRTRDRLTTDEEYDLTNNYTEIRSETSNSQPTGMKIWEQKEVRVTAEAVNNNTTSAGPHSSTESILPETSSRVLL